MFYLYLAILLEAIVLIRMDNKGAQKPIYYTSLVLQNAKTRNSKVKKMVDALIIFTQWLRQYFQADLIIVLTDQPLKVILQ